jgi:hypothetical protein
LLDNTLGLFQISVKQILNRGVILKKQLKENFVCCDQCFESIGKRSVKAARLWLELCSLHSFSNGIFSIAQFASKELIELEKMGFILTHEIKDSLLVRMQGYHTSPCTYFCTGDCNE